MNPENKDSCLGNPQPTNRISALTRPKPSWDNSSTRAQPTTNALFGEPSDVGAFVKTLTGFFALRTALTRYIPNGQTGQRRDGKNGQGETVGPLAALGRLAAIGEDGESDGNHD
jgi:hypothetical protein